MKRDTIMVIELPSEALENFRVMIVMNGGAIISEKSTSLKVRFEEASKNFEDELVFFESLLAEGVTLEDIKEEVPESYEYSKKFLEEHGLI